MADLTSRVVQTIGKHFVTLSCVQQLPAGSSENTLVFSGFVVDVSGEWFYVTAGHILRDLRAALAAGSSFSIWRLDDQTAGNRFNGKAVPYDFDIETWLVFDDRKTGLDYAAVHLGDFYRRQLEAGGVAAIARNAWSDHLTEHDYWALIGIPSETVAYDGKTSITARVVLSPLIPADEPVLAGDRAQNQFYARPKDSSEQFWKDADGLSGAPVFTLKKVGAQWMYAVIGVQSAWYETSKTLAICPFSSFGLALEEVVADVRKLQNQSRNASSAT